MTEEIVDQFPLPNEHSARLLNPNTPHIRVRRTSGSGDGAVQGVKIPATIDIIWYIVKSEGKEVPRAQALRFPTKNWTEAEARKWLKDNKIKYLSFEPAEKTKENQIRPAINVTDLNDPSRNPFVFNMPGTVEFADGEGGDEKKKIRLNLYDGSVVRHWYWGNLAFDLATMRMAKKKNPILFLHDVEQRIGVCDIATFDGNFVMEGSFLESSKKGQEIKEQMIEGFPFEASLRFDPNRSKIEFVKDDETAECNGQKIRGPGTIIRNATVIEGSVCVFGALKNTQTEAFEIVNEILKLKEKDMTKEKIELTLETFAEQYPEIHSEMAVELRKEGELLARELFRKFTEKFGDDPAFCIEHFSRGETLEQATEARLEKLKKEKEDLAEQAKLLTKTRIDPAVQEFTDQQKSKDETRIAEVPEEKYKKEFAASQAIQDEFGGANGLSDYLAYRKAQDAGRTGGW